MAAIKSLRSTLPATPTPVLDLPESGVRPVGSERRLCRRSSRQFHARVLADNTILRGIDLSFGGMMCAGEQPIWPGNVLALELFLSGEPKTITLEARVVDLVGRAGELAMRLRFEGLSALQKKRIARWVEEL